MDGRTGGLLAMALLLSACAPTAQPPRYPEASWSSGIGAASLGITQPTNAPTCTPDTAPTSVAGYNRWMSGLSGLTTWRSADVGASVRLVDGRVAWVFGDTARDATVNPRFASSSMLITRGDCTVQAVDHGLPLVPNSPGTACWPSSLVARSTATGDDLWIACSRIERTGSGLYDFDYLGASIATLHIPRGGAPSNPRVVQITPDRRDAAQLNWGAAMVIDGGFLYVYGTYGAAIGAGPRALSLARMPVGDATRPTAWTYWDGSGWASSAQSVSPVVSADPGVSQALSVHRIDGSFVAVSKKGGDLSDTLGLWTAPTAQGPWTLVHEQPLPHAEGNGVVTYQPLAHPELTLADGKLLVSYSRNPTDQNRLLTEPALGRPRFLEVPLP
ncbi:DUF4185 domain-containing protein [Calidifontibacter terrae]